MEIYTCNILKLTAENEDAFIKAELVIQSYIGNEEAWGCSTIKDIFNKTQKLYILETEFDPWSPPFEVYAKLQAIEGISIDASLVIEREDFDTRYRWTGEGCNLIAVETNLHDWDSDYQDFEDCLKLKISSLQKQRGNLDLAIDALLSLSESKLEINCPF